MDLSARKHIDPKRIDRSILRQRSGVKIDPKAPHEERVRQLFQQIDPYCYLDGKTVVICRFADTEKSITDCFCDYLAGA
jgi:hypothetical protein